MKFKVRVRITDNFQRAIHEDQEYEAESGLDAMKMAVEDEKNTSRGLVQCNGADHVPSEEPIIPVKGVDNPVQPGELVATEPMVPGPKKRGPKPKGVPAE